MTGKRLIQTKRSTRWTGGRFVMMLAAMLLALLAVGLYLWRGRPMLFGTLLCGAGAIWCLGWAVSRSRAIHGVLLGGAVLCLTGFLALEGIILASSRDDVTGEPDTMVILGAAVWGSDPSRMMQWRCDKALRYWETHPNVTIVVSGGQGEGEDITEAQAMTEYLTARGVTEGQILQENQSTNTLQNLRNTTRLLEGQGKSVENLLVVSNGFHLCRVKLLAHRLGLEISTLSAPAKEPVSRAYFYARESLGLVKSWLLDRA